MEATGAPLPPPPPSSPSPAIQYMVHHKSFHHYEYDACYTVKKKKKTINDKSKVDQLQCAKEVVFERYFHSLLFSGCFERCPAHAKEFLIN